MLGVGTMLGKQKKLLVFCDVSEQLSVGGALSSSLAISVVVLNSFASISTLVLRAVTKLA